MKGKILGMVLGLSMIASVGFASPLNDFSQGNVSLELSARPSNDLKVSDNQGSTTYDAKTFYDYGITAGLGNNFALQYKYSNPKSKDYFGISGQLTVQEFNVLYKVDNHNTVFTGVNTVKDKYSGLGYSSEGDTKTNWQLGVTSQTNLNDNIIGYATLAAGNDTTAWKVGASYVINKNLDFDLFYGWNKYKNVKYGSALANIAGTDKADYTAKGMGYGLTYKF